MRFPLALILCTACGNPTFEGRYTIDEVTQDGCGVGDGPIGSRVSISDYERGEGTVRSDTSVYRVDFNASWDHPDFDECSATGNTEVGFACWSDRDEPQVVFTGFVDVEAGTIQLLQHGRDQCTTELVGHWTGGLPDCLFFCDPVLVAPN